MTREKFEHEIKSTRYSMHEERRRVDTQLSLNEDWIHSFYDECKTKQDYETAISKAVYYINFFMAYDNIGFGM